MLGWSVVIILDSYPNNAFFYTIWNFIVLLVYFFLASCHSVWGLLLKREAPSEPARPLVRTAALRRDAGSSSSDDDEMDDSRYRRVMRRVPEPKFSPQDDPFTLTFA